MSSEMQAKHTQSRRGGGQTNRHSYFGSSCHAAEDSAKEAGAWLVGPGLAATEEISKHNMDIEWCVIVGEYDITKLLTDHLD